MLDFVNDPAEIQEAFRHYYEGSVMDEEIDPNGLYEVKAALDASGICLQIEVADFALVFFAPKRRQSPGDHKMMKGILDQPERMLGLTAGWASRGGLRQGAGGAGVAVAPD